APAAGSDGSSTARAAESSVSSVFALSRERIGSTFHQMPYVHVVDRRAAACRGCRSASRLCFQTFAAARPHCVHLAEDLPRVIAAGSALGIEVVSFAAGFGQIGDALLDFIETAGRR